MFHAAEYGRHGQTQRVLENTENKNLNNGRIPQDQEQLTYPAQGQEIINDLEMAGMAAPPYTLHTSDFSDHFTSSNYSDPPLSPVINNGNSNINDTNGEPMHQEFYSTEDCIDPNFGTLT